MSQIVTDMKTSQIIKILISAILIFAVIACTKSSSDSNDGGSTPPNNGGGSGNESRTNCGVVINSKVVNPVSSGDGQTVRISQVADSNAFIVKDSAGGQLLVKLHGISSEPAALKDNAISFLKRYVGKNVLFIRASDSCSALLPGGGLAQVGQLVTSTQESIAESLVRTGFAVTSSADGCSSDLITSCLTALHESDPQTAGELTSFLWKPQADSDGNLAIHTGPFGTTVSVNGEVGRNQGSGNGFGSLARFTRPGCSYGNARVVVRSSSGFPYTVGGQASFGIPNPCGRHCLQGGKIVACSK